VLDDIRTDAEGERVLLVVHQVVVLLTRYVLEGMDEHQVLALDAEAEVLNCAVTSYSYDRTQGGWSSSATTRRPRSRSRTPP
jgi:broad specificity phosphatase PhoE